MAVQLGSRGLADFTEPLALLSECHRRVEKFLGVLAEVGRKGGGELDGPHREALTKALDYFRSAAPMHTADEEASLFPRLRAVGGADVEAALAKVERLESDHRDAEPKHQRVDELGRRWLNDGRLSPGEAADFARLVDELRNIYRDHIALEDREVFPLAGRVLAADAVAALGREMAARRGNKRCSERAAAAGS
jgi:hemerythrin-like domain-containing protein